MDTPSVAVDRWLTKSITDNGAVFHVLKIIHLRVQNAGPCLARAVQANVH